MKTFLSVLFATLFFAQAVAIAQNPQATGLPIIRIETQNSAPINSKEVYTIIESISISDPSNSSYNISRRRSDIARPDIDRPNDEIRGRGNASWEKPEYGNMNYPKKPYRLRFNDKVSLFGLEAARNWILLAEYRDPSYIVTPITFYVSKNIFEMPFTHNYFHVHLYINNDYRGLYGLTEHKQVNPGRIDIDPNEGWHVNIDEYYDEDPKFKVEFNSNNNNNNPPMFPPFGNNSQLPIMIKSPEAKDNAKEINNPAYQFVKNDWNELSRLMNAGDFPNNGYRDLIDMSTFVNYLLVSEIIRNWEELLGPKSMQAYKDKGGKMSLGPLWDFDCGFGYNYQSTHIYYATYRDFIQKHNFLNRFYDDPIFRSDLRKRWDEKYEQVRNATAQIDAIASKIRSSVSEDAKRWYNSNNQDRNVGYVAAEYDTNHVQVTNKLKEWWRQRVEWLNGEIRNQYQAISSSSTMQSSSSSLAVQSSSSVNNGISSSSAAPQSSSSEAVSPILIAKHSLLDTIHSSYYNLKGIPLGTQKPTKPGVYILKTGNKIQRVVVR
jgi:hypothetical protein